MYSILREIEEYIKERRMPFKSIKINYSYFSKYINYVILENLRRLNSNKTYEYGPMEYTLSFDKEGHLYLLAKANDMRSNFIVSWSNKLALDFPFEGVDEENLITQACIYKSLEDFRKIIEEDINRENYTFRGKTNVINKIMRRARSNEFYRMRDNYRSVLEQYNYKDELMDTVRKIKEYLDYLFLIYKDTINSDNEDRMMHGVSYIENNDNEEEICVGTIESIGKIIANNDKLDIIEGYPYIYHDFAFDCNTYRIKYINYLYRIGHEEYLLLCKHKDDKKDTKMVFMHSDRKLYKDDFNLIIKYYLELSDIEFDNSIGTMRINSQDLVDYKMMLNYIVYNREEELVQDSFKVKVRKLREEGR